MNIITPLFHIISCVVNHTDINWVQFKAFSPKDWEQLYTLSKKQGVVAIVFEKIKNIPKSIAPPKELSLKWLSHAISIETQMRTKEATAIEFANKLSERDIQVAVLKGIAFASYFPNPYHRESGDLDCYLMGKKEEGDRIVSEIGGRMVEAGDMHSHLYYKGLTIENHNLLTSTDKSKSSIKIESLLQKLIIINPAPISETRLLNPCADFNALFLIKHAQRHFIKEGICVRHILDWAFFLQAESHNVNWGKVIPLMEECRILNFAKALTSICVENFGMVINIKGINEPSEISNSVLEDILGDHPNFFHENITQKIKRIIRRFYRMWKFRSIAYKSYIGLVWESFVVSSFLKRKLKL